MFIVGCFVRFSIIVDGLASTPTGCHSPLLDQQDGYQYQQDENEDPSAEPSYLHHPIRLFGGVRDDLWLLCSTFNIGTIKSFSALDLLWEVLAFSVMSGLTFAGHQKWRNNIAHNVNLETSLIKVLKPA